MVGMFKEASLKEAKLWGNAEYLEEGLVLTDHIANAPYSHEPTRLNFILMALCNKGSAKYSIDTREQVVKPGDLLFISERHIIDNYTATPDFECLCIMLNTEFYHGFIQNVQNVLSLLLFSMNNPVVSLIPQEIQVYTNYFQTIREKMADTHHHYRVNLVKALLLAMFYDMSNVIWRVEQGKSMTRTRGEAIFAQFLQMLEQHFRAERRVSWYAEQLCITPKYLSEIVKSISKRTPNEWIDSYVILELRVQLKNTTKPIKKITEELNFPNQSFLGKYFKERTGLSPSEYRKA
jgi:AraC-like DNA-binding protein